MQKFLKFLSAVYFDAIEIPTATETHDAAEQGAHTFIVEVGVCKSKKDVYGMILDKQRANVINDLEERLNELGTNSPRLESHVAELELAMTFDMND